MPSWQCLGQHLRARKLLYMLGPEVRGKVMRCPNRMHLGSKLSFGHTSICAKEKQKSQLTGKNSKPLPCLFIWLLKLHHVASILIPKGSRVSLLAELLCRRQDGGGKATDPTQLVATYSPGLVSQPPGQVGGFTYGKCCRWEVQSCARAQI